MADVNDLIQSTESLTLRAENTDDEVQYIVDLYVLQNDQYVLVHEDVRLVLGFEKDRSCFALVDCVTTSVMCALSALNTFVNVLSYWVLVETQHFKICLSFEDLHTSKQFLDWWHLQRDRYYGTTASVISRCDARCFISDIEHK